MPQALLSCFRKGGVSPCRRDPRVLPTFTLFPLLWFGQCCRHLYPFRCLNCRVSDEEAFLRAVSAGSNVIPISRRIFSDHLTPVLAYRCLVKEDDRDAPSFLFESVETANDGRARSGRYSYVGAQPALEVVARGVGPVSVVNHDLGKRETMEGKDPLQ
ncbi:unnamed protein product, partial [Closterium sp. Naga37s-1]